MPSANGLTSPLVLTPLSTGSSPTAAPAGYEVEDFIRRSEDSGAVMVRIGVDDEDDQVQADLSQLGDLAVIEHAIGALAALNG
jgi:hypothetical protein